MGMTYSRSYVVGITGASGVIYGVRLVKWLLNQGHAVHLVVSESGCLVLRDELGWEVENARDVSKWLHQGNLTVYENNQMDAVIASGSYRHQGMVVVPCSMATLAGIASGSSRTLIERAADVALKESLPLILVPRETPLNRIHIRNMLQAAEAGACILPAMPGFYGRPAAIDELVDFIVGRILDNLHLDNDLYRRYKGQYQE